jgi:hypothetical protein
MRSSCYAGRLGLAVLAAVLPFSAACGTDGGTPSAATGSTATSATTTTATTTAQAPEVTAACPLVDPTVIQSNYSVQSPQLTEKEPVKTGPATTYACDLSDGGELFLTAGVSIGPRSGTAEANLRAALSDNQGEPVEGLGEVGGYHEQDGIATAAGVKNLGDSWLVVFVHGAAGNKAQLVAVAQDLAKKV